MKITVTKQILSMGDGWKDEHKAAMAYSSFYEEEIKEIILDRYPANSVEVVFKNSGGYRGVLVDGAGEYETDLEDILNQYDNTIWDEWCSSEDAEEYLDED